MDTTLIAQLIEKGDYDKARAEISVLLENLKPSKKDTGEAYANLASIYFQLNTAILEDYKKLQEEIIEELRNLNLKEKLLTQI